MIRFRVVLALAAFGAATVFTLYLFHRSQTSGSPPGPTSSVRPASAEPDVESASPKPEGLTLSANSTAPASEAVATRPQQPASSTDHQTYVEQRVTELADLATQSDSASLQAIVAELTNRDPEIREAALDATIQFGSRDAIPALMDAATQAEDGEQRNRIQQAIDYLRLPPLSEVSVPRKAPAPKLQGPVKR